MRMWNSARFRLGVATVGAAILLAAYGCGDDGGGDDDDDTSGGSGSPGVAGASASGGLTGSSGMVGTDGNTYVGLGCLDGATQCTNCEDDDGDGLVDSLDPECSGPLDDDEGSFATGIPGDNMDDCQDCFFDGNSGHGDDGCQYATECLYGEVVTGSSGCQNCEVAAECVDFCAPYTPNGCDCFGCCTIETDEGVYNILLSETCSLEDVADPELCQECTPTEECGNECGRCELCVGKDTIPEDCFVGGGGASGTGGTGGQVCDDGAPICNADIPCPAGHYCLTGCCILALPE